LGKLKKAEGLHNALGQTLQKAVAAGIVGVDVLKVKIDYHIESGAQATAQKNKIVLQATHKSLQLPVM
jgi:hypothetical protein